MRGTGLFAIGAVVGYGDVDRRRMLSCRGGRDSLSSRNRFALSCAICVSAIVLGCAYASINKSGVRAILGDGIRYLFLLVLIWTFWAIAVSVIPHWSPGTSGLARGLAILI